MGNNASPDATPVAIATQRILGEKMAVCSIFSRDGSGRHKRLELTRRDSITGVTSHNAQNARSRDSECNGLFATLTALIDHECTMPRIMHKLAAPIARVLLTLFLCILSTNCYPPMKVHTRVKPVTGTGEDLRAAPDTNVIHPGVTTRTDVLRQFAAFDTGWRGERLFLGRWLYSGMVGNGGRWWAGKILAVEFDEKGLVTRYRVLSDDDFLRDQDSWPLAPAKDAPRDQQTDSTVTVKTENVAGRSVLFLNIHGYRIAAQEIEGLDRWPYAAVYAARTTFAGHLGLVVHLKEKIFREGDVERRHGVTKITLETDVPTAVLLMRFMRRSVNDGSIL